MIDGLDPYPDTTEIDRKARISELECLQTFHEDTNNDYGEQQVIDTSAYIDERLAELKGE